MGPNRTFIATKPVYGNSRKKAVQQAVQWFWKDFKGLLGPAHKVMTINDPYEEVRYDDNFACNELGNKYLDCQTIDRLLDQANGELAIDDSPGSERHPRTVLKELEEGEQNVQLTSRLSQSPGGTIYYKMSFPSSDTNSFKVKIIKLSSKSLEKAKREVERRGLDKFEKSKTLCNVAPKSKKKKLKLSC